MSVITNNNIVLNKGSSIIVAGCCGPKLIILNVLLFQCLMQYSVVKYLLNKGEYRGKCFELWIKSKT